jgi:arsenate reductase-like glutaredoxin family protein
VADARKTPLKWDDVRKLIRDVDEIYIAKGKQVIHIHLKSGKPEPDTLARLLLRPGGNLRAPTFRKGRTLVVGFDEATYRKILRGA